MAHVSKNVAQMQAQHPSLLAAVRKNCHISDALHAGDYTLCVYLLKMREYFRWEKGYSFATALPHEAVSHWLRERERYWESLENEDFTPLPINGDHYDPFETDRLNDLLNPKGLVYSAGMGQQGRAHFFLGQLVQRQEHGDFTVLISADEYARDLTAPPAMTLGKTIFIRRESLRRMLWERIEEWRWNSPDNAMGRTLAYYPFDEDTDAALEKMTDEQLQVLLLHEIGEVMAHDILGSAWETMLAELPRSRTELGLRAVRDQLADALSTLPSLLREDALPASLHFFFATLTPLRKQLAPALLQAYDSWHRTGDKTPLLEHISGAQAHWRQLACRLLEAYQARQPLPQLQTLIDTNTL